MGSAQSGAEWRRVRVRENETRLRYGGRRKCVTATRDEARRVVVNKLWVDAGWRLTGDG